MDIDPVRKRNGSSEIYTRRRPVAELIKKSLQWPFEDVLDRAAIRRRDHSDYVPSEVLVYHLRRAIDALPADEREGIDLMLVDIPIETNKDGEPSMTVFLGCVEKTVRNRRDRAFAKIRQELDVEVDNGE